MKAEMEASEIAQIARKFSVLVRVQGPDPKGLKMRRNSFYLHQLGKTTISASGLLLPASLLSQTARILKHIQNISEFSGAVVVTVASVVQPFLVAEHRNKLTQDILPRLIPNACIDVLMEGRNASYDHEEPGATSEWLPAKLLSVVDVPIASDALLSLFGGQSSWEASWSLSPFITPQALAVNAYGEKIGNTVDSRKDIAVEELNNPALLAISATRIAFLGISIPEFKNGPCITISQHQSRGGLIVVVGSPFGVLSPVHFFNSISVGNLANCCSSGLNKCALLMADIRCLPGMEGGPVFDRHACLAGILIKPLRQKGSNTEIQFAVSWNAIASIHNESMQNGVIDRTECSNHMVSSYDSTAARLHKTLIRRPVISSHSISSLEMAISSVVLVAVGDGSWASGIVLNSRGLILTNAHILEPWRFGKSSQLGSIEKASSQNEIEPPPIGPHGRNFIQEESESHIHQGAHPFSKDGKLCSKNLSVRLDFMERKTWYSAREIYVSKGPLDVALLQLESVPPEISSIIPQLAPPCQGAVVHVIGHGLLGPRSNTLSSVSSGVVSNFLEIPGPIHVYESSKSEARKISFPVMLQTTAAVHPGASGGAVVNSEGHMIGLVTSNTRHGGGTIIPHLNFSIPCAALEPVFKFSDTQDASLLEILDKPNELLSSVWALVPTDSTNQDSKLKNNKYNQGKGLRFAQFLAEKNTDMMNSLKNRKLPSKI